MHRHDDVELGSAARDGLEEDARVSGAWTLQSCATLESTTDLLQAASWSQLQGVIAEPLVLRAGE